MKISKTDELREAYLSFFESKGHKRIKSASLVPENDPTTLFTGSGMQAILPFLLGQPHPEGKRITDSQKCFRLTDIDEVGDNRHTTFFEMLGNWSLGDYFKAEQIPWIFDFLVNHLKLAPNRVYVTVFRGDDKFSIPRDETSAQLWQKQFKEVGLDAPVADFPERDGLQDSRIFYYAVDKNWWSRSGEPKQMPVGEPGGPDSEVFWDFGMERQLHEQSEWKDKPCHVNCDCGRFLEIGNNVFMQYMRKDDGFDELPQKNVDFGGGLERLMAAINDEPDIFLIDVFDGARIKLEEISGQLYGDTDDNTAAYRVILDHLRAAVHLAADNVLPGNKDQAYFVRRLIRRAVRYGDKLGIGKSFCASIAGEFISTYANSYHTLEQKRAGILSAIDAEEVKFRRTLQSGLRRFEAIVKDKNKELSADQVFDLYQSYGFPLEMSQELAQERGLPVDTAGFKKKFAEHQETSRAGAKQKFVGGLADHSEQSIRYHTATHLLHQALREVLGKHVTQKGSNITKDRLRFDFSHPKKMTLEEIKEVEDLVNARIKENLAINRSEMTVAEAKEKGALGLFEDKYGAKVSVYEIGSFSVEICGGPHVLSTGQLGDFKIKKEESAGANLRRIKAVLD